MYKNTMQGMSFSQGDILIRQSYMKEAQAMVWSIYEFRRCEGQYADEGDHAWLLMRGMYPGPYPTREKAIEALGGE